MNKIDKLYENREHFESIVSKCGGLSQSEFYRTHVYLTSKVLANLANKGLEEVFESKLIVCVRGTYYSNVKYLRECIQDARKGSFTQIPFMYYEIVLEKLELMLLS